MSKVDKIIKYSLFLILLLPLAFTPFTFFPWHYGKTVIFQIIVEVLAVLWVWGRLSSPRKRGSSQSIASPNVLDSPLHGNDSQRVVFWRMLGRLNLLDWSILVFLLILTLTSLTGANPSNSFWGNQARVNGVFTWWHFGAFYFLLKYYFKNLGHPVSVIPAKAGIQNGSKSLDSRPPMPLWDKLRGNDKERPSWSFLRILTVAVIVAVLASLTSLFPNLLPTAWQAASGGGIIGNRAFLASYLVLAMGLCLYLFFTFKNKWRCLFIGAVAINLIALYLTSNRGSLIGLVSGILVGLPISFFVFSNKKYKIIISSCFIALFSLLIALFFLSQNKQFQASLPRLYNLFDLSNYTSGTGETRLMAWQIALQGLKDKPFLGWGLGNYEIIFNRYYNPQFLKHSFTETVWDKPHNWLLEIGESAGILGMLAYLAIYIIAFYYLFKKTKIKPVATVIFSATLFAYFIQSLFLFETTNSLILWSVILAFVSASAASGCHPRESGDPVGNKRIGLLDSHFRRVDKVRQLFVLLAILPISYLLFLNFRFLKSSYYMRQAELGTSLMEWTGFSNQALAIKVPFLSENAIFLAEQLTKFDKAGAIVKEKKVEDAALKIADILEGASSKYPNNLSFPVWAGQVYVVLGEKFDKKNYQKAEKNLLKAEKISPNKQEVLFLLGRLYLLTRDFNKAIDFQKKAVVAAPEINISHWFLGLTYVAQGERAKGLEEIENAMELGYNLTADQKLYVLDLYALEKNYSKLIEEYKKSIEGDPGNLNWYVKLAVVYAESGDKKSALETVRYAVGLFPPLKAEADKFIKQYKLE